MNNFNSQVTALNVALADTEGTVPFHEAEDPTMGSLAEGGYRGQQGRVVSVKCRTLDSIVEELGVEPDFLKIDVEGFEHLVLLGGGRVLTKFRPSIVLEANPGDPGEAITEILLKHGYKFQNITESGLRSRSTISPDKQYHNWLCTPNAEEGREARQTQDAKGGRTPAASVFDAGAPTFAHDIDVEIQEGCYRRGDLFVQFADRAVRPGSLILDYGCGPGRISLMLARSGLDVIGVDPSEEMIAQAKEQQDTQDLCVQFRVAGEGALKPDAFDAIVCSSVIEYSSDPDQLLQLFHRSLRGPGTLIISYSNRRSLYRLYSKLTGPQNPFTTPHHQSWTWREFRRLLDRNGFSCTHGPKFFESHWRLDPFLSKLPIGTLGIVAARKVKPSPTENLP